MADATVTSTVPRPRKNRWLRISAWVFGALLILLLVAYFVGTSSAFFKGVILPKASAALNAKVTISDASLSPFHSVILRNLKIETTGSEPLVSAPEVRLRYSLMDIIRGTIHVEEITVASPTVVLVTNPDKTSNLDPILKNQQQKPAETPSKPSKPAQLDIKSIAVTDATIRQVKLYAGNYQDLTEISHANLNISNVKNGQPGKLSLAADILMRNNPPPPATNGSVQAKLDGSYDFALTPDLKPGSIQGNTRLAVTRAEGALAQAASFGASLTCDVTPTEIKQVALRFQKGDTRLGELLVTGPFDMDKSEGKLTIALANVDKNLLNLAGASSGLDFGPTTINSTNLLQLTKAGNAITASGQFNLNQLQIMRTNQTTPPLDLSTRYDVSVDLASSNAVLRVMNLTGAQKGNQFLRGELSSPMTVSWGNTANAVGDSTLNITVTNFDLADWKPFLGQVAPAGKVGARLQLLSQQAGKKLGFDLNSEVANLTAGSGSNQITQATVTFTLHGQATDLKQFSIPDYKFTLARQNQLLLTATGSCNYDQGSQAADVQLTSQFMLARLLQVLPRNDMNVSSGTAELKLHITQKAQPAAAQAPGSLPAATRDIVGSFALSDLNGKIGSNVFRSFGTTADLDLGLTPRLVQIRKLSGKLTEGTNSGGMFDLSGTYDLTNSATRLTAKLADFNQNGLRAFLEPMLGDKKLVSVALNANAAVQYDPQAASTVKGALQMTNLVVNDPKGQFPAKPLEARMLLDVALNKQVADVRQFQLALTPTARAANQVNLTAHLDMSDTNALQGNIKAAADTLDLTSYYDLFGEQKAAATPSPAAGTKPTSPAPATPSTESQAPTNRLPFRNFVADATVGRLYLREVDVANFQLTTKIDGGHVVVNPFKLALNGAPMDSTVDVDLGVPGYKYDVGFNAQAIPLAPLVNTFEPDRKGVLSGTLTGQAKISGVGTGGTNLQKTLAGSFDLSSTNLNLVVDNIPNDSVSTRLLKVLVNAISIVPDIAKNPVAGASSLVQGFTRSGGGGNTNSAGGGVLKKSPIDAIVLHGTMGSGTIALQQAMIQSPAFRAEASGGTVTLAPILTNSTVKLPVAVSLERSVAQSLNLAGNTPTNAPYTRLPDFLAMKGTLGEPKTDINELALGSAVLQGVGGRAGQIGNLLQGAQGLLGGRSSTNTTGTNQSGSKLGDLLHGLEGALGGKSAGTNAPSTSTNKATTNQSPVNSLLDLLGPKKK
jgi:uncharacterized protein involved in outer membrane biogenesis